MIKIKLAGTILGSAKGWDELGALCLAFYDVEITNKAAFLNSKVFPNIELIDRIDILFDEGLVNTFDKDGKSIDIDLKLEL